jgi:flavodoxin
MKALVVSYSRTGLTAKVAEAIAKELGCQHDEIRDTIIRAGPLGFLRSGFEAAMKVCPVISVKKDPARYDLVVIGTPVWAGTMSSPVRTYLDDNNARFKKVAFFCTSGNGNGEKIFAEMAGLGWKKPMATLALFSKDVATGNFGENVKKFCGRLRDREQHNT